MSHQMLKSEEIQIRQNALATLQSGHELLNKSYLASMGQFEIQSLEHYAKDKAQLATDVRIFKIERIVLENKQSVLESMTAAYTALGTAGYSVFLLLQGTGTQTNVYLGVRGQAGKIQGNTIANLVEKTFKGHFSGSQLNMLKGVQSEAIIKQLTAQTDCAVTAVTGVPSLSVQEREHFMQGLEHFIDAAEGREYTAMILAEPVGSQQLDMIQAGYEITATHLSPLQKQTLSFGENESDSVGLSISQGISQALGVSLGLTETHGTSESTTSTITNGTSESLTNTVTHGTSDSTSGKSTLGKIGTLGLSAIGVVGGVVLAPATGGASLAMSMAAAGAGMGAMASGALFDTHSKGTSYSNSTGTTSGTSYSESTGTTAGTSYSTAQSKTTTDTHTTSTNDTRSLNKTTGTNRQITLEMTDKQIEQMLKKIDQQLERVNEARRYGAWQTAAYFVGDSIASSQSLASIFLGLMRGAESNSENFALTTWDSEEQKSTNILQWLGNLSHPRLKADAYKQLDVSYLTPAILVSGKEMAMQLALPRRSTSTVTVVEAVPFGRRIQSTNLFNSSPNRTIELGQIHHLWKDLPQKVTLDVDKLSGHLFITGATGSGKSNTVYHLLNELNKQEIKFLIIEPAKGEYKHVFGNRSDVKVFGTNPNMSDLLKINPFKFPSTGHNPIHVLEHIDRLIEIFSMCWSMYDAMPAMLKQALLKAYELSGWDLDSSVNYYDNALFPSFVDLLQCLESEIEKSNYSAEVKSNYKGALITRVASLTTGLNKQLFSADEIDDNILFDENVIVDLSRVGSQETKSLIMGILVLRLNEYRMVNAVQMNTPLKHITVLEEAHNLLKNHTTHSEHGSNIASKSVELLSNAIAEMRTFGEGFIIADQSPNAVDISAIRNTNTKIIMRLPDETDGRLIGKASGLTDEQLPEIAKLPQGVAVIYQNDWLEPILCKVSYFDTIEHTYQYVKDINDVPKRQNTELAKFILGHSDYNRDIVQAGIFNSGISVECKLTLLNAFNQMQKPFTEYVIDRLLDILAIKNITRQYMCKQQSMDYKEILSQYIFDEQNIFEKIHVHLKYLAEKEKFRD